MAAASTRSFRRAGCLGALVLLLTVLAGGKSATQAPPPPSKDVVYILPLWLQYQSADEETFAREVAELRRRLGPETPRVRLGFTAYVFLSMDEWNIDPSDTEAVRRALSVNIAQVDEAIARARRHQIPLCLSLVTALRERYDPVQQAAEREDRRNTQWYADGSLANGWVTHSRYARKHRRILEAYVREVGRVIATRMAKYPETLVAASGDGEVELAYGKSPDMNPSYTVETMLLADYSPFAVAEFRDWLRGRGLYGAGGPFAGEAYENAARYGGDVSPAADTNRDGHTLNGDFGTAFTTWELSDFDWSLEDEVMRDPHAIPARTYEAPGWNRRSLDSARDRSLDSARGTPGTVRVGFDPPRAWKQGDGWWEIWHRFRQTMVWRHNRDFSRWISTSVDPETGARVPQDRWYSDQIAADYLFGSSPENPSLRFITSASAWWTADVAPYGRLGITSFNTNVNGTVFRTLAAVAPHISERSVDWGILEWHPSAPETKDLDVYRSEARLVELYRPALVVPIFWEHDLSRENLSRVKDTGFEVALRELVAAMSKGPPAPAIELTPGRLNFAATASGRLTPAQRLRIQVVGRGRIGWTAAASDPLVVLSRTSGAGSADVDVSIAGPEVGAADRRLTITIASPQSSTPRVEMPVLVRPIDGNGAPPYGSIDAPAEGAAVPSSFYVGGWALDDVGVVSVEVWREPLAGESAGANGLIRIGAAAFSRGTRPDVAAIFPDAPLWDRAGWGLRVTMPPEIRGAIRLHVLVTDIDGHVHDLGARAVRVQAP